MKKLLISLFTVVLTFSLIFMGIGCKGAVEEAVTEAVEEAVEAVEEAVEEVEEAPEEVTEEPAVEQFITIHWAQWAPADYLEKLSEGFTAETGIKVIVEQTPWETFVQKYNTEMIARSDAWDIIVGDSQDIGNMAVNGHYVDLTDWIIENGVDKTFTPASLTYYAEYPKGAGKYYAVPCEGDALGWAYRKDLFEDADNMAAFEAEYGYALGIPESWDNLKDIAEFFHDPDNDFYGVAIYGDNGYDSLAMFAEQVIWSFGGELGDYATYEVDGLLNSEGAIAGIEYYHELFQFVPPGFGDAFFIKTNDAFVAGIVPMTTNYFAFFPGLANEATNPYAADTGYFACPPQVGSDGEERQFAALGGQGLSVVAYSEKQDLAYQYLTWFVKEETQMEWAKLGGYTCHAGVLESDEFLNATPYNPAFKVSMEIFKDWWACPEYDELLRTFSENIAKYVVAGDGTAEEALNKCVEDWEEIFEAAGY
jgi:multiple sugar transport system substrate-binding protein